MEPYIKKAAIVAEIDDMLNTKEHTSHCDEDSFNSGRWKALTKIKGFLNTLEVIDPYEQCIQYPTVKDGIKAHAEVYSFNIESELFNQLTKEQQELWRNEIEQAVISGGEVGVELARDMRYKENLEVKDGVDSNNPTSPNSLKISRSGNSHIGENRELERIISKACDWLADNYSKYIITNGLATIFSATIDFDTIRMIEDLKKAIDE